LDIKINSKDKKRFENIIDKLTKNQITKDLINEMQQLANKYPKSCVIKYDLAVMYMRIKNYQKAKNLLFNLKNCNSDVLKEKERLINILERIYF
jgi:predicted Zn-dependent protease